MEHRERSRFDSGRQWATRTDDQRRLGDWPTVDRRSPDSLGRRHHMYGRRRTDRLPPLPVLPRRALVAKRALDILLSGGLLVVCAPLMAVICVLVRITSRGPVFFRQQRVGRDGIPFTLIKFRTMRNGTEELIRNNPHLWSIYVTNDHKIPASAAPLTPIGGILRKSSLDELPQLINVLKGEMSIVGIRPLESEQVTARPYYSQRLYGVLPPGMTGLWQVNGRSKIQDPGRTMLDDEYITNWSFYRDLVIIARTPAALTRVSECH